MRLELDSLNLVSLLHTCMHSQELFVAAAEHVIQDSLTPTLVYVNPKPSMKSEDAVLHSRMNQHQVELRHSACVRAVLTSNRNKPTGCRQEQQLVCCFPKILVSWSMHAIQELSHPVSDDAQVSSCTSIDKHAIPLYAPNSYCF
jgi:hypothetical protein